MSAKEKQVVDIQGQFDEITECPICKETYKEPKILPCIHTFCITCLQETGLKTNKSPGVKMPCPVCRTEFTVPEKGFVGLQRNFFMERLIEMKNILNPSSESALCDACQEDNDLGAEVEIPSAEMYCTDCNQRLCRECCKMHRKNKASKNHRMVQLDGAQINIPLIVKPYVCDKHGNKPLEIYCKNCQEAICALCFFDGHKEHETSPVINVGAKFRRNIQEKSDSMLNLIVDLKNKLLKKGNDKALFASKVAGVESEIKTTRQSLQECTEKHCDAILQQLISIKQEKNKKSESQQYDIETVLASLISYQAYCTQVTTLGSDVDICRAAHNLNTRAAELKERYEAIPLEPFPNIWLKKPEFHDVFRRAGNNIIGEIEENSLSIPVAAKASHSESGAECSRGIACDACQETDEDIDQKEDSQDPLHVHVHVGLNSRMEELNLRVSELEQELELMKGKEKERKHIETRLRYYKPTPCRISEINTSMMKFGFTTVTGLTIMDNELFITAKDCTDLGVFDSTTYDFKRLLRVSELSDPWDMCSCPRHNCLYIATGDVQNGQMRFSVDSTVKITEKIGSDHGKILRLDKVGKVQHSWNIGDDYGTLAITGEGNVILTVPIRGKLVEYDTNGKCLREIIISTDVNLGRIPFLAKPAVSGSKRIICPRQSEKLSTGNFLINYFLFENSPGRSLSFRYINKAGLCMTNGQGLVINVFQGNRGTGFGELEDPLYFAVDKDMAVLVLERYNRISLLNPKLEYTRELVSVAQKSGLLESYKMCLDEVQGKLLLARADAQNDHVLVYEIKAPRDRIG